MHTQFIVLLYQWWQCAELNQRIWRKYLSPLSQWQTFDPPGEWDMCCCCFSSLFALYLCIIPCLQWFALHMRTHTYAYIYIISLVYLWVRVCMCTCLFLPILSVSMCVCMCLCVCPCQCLRVCVGPSNPIGWSLSQVFPYGLPDEFTLVLTLVLTVFSHQPKLRS